MVYYSQRDPRWKNKEIICSDGRKDNIENVGCGQTSVAMIIATYGNGSQTPETIADKYFSEGYCDGTGLEELGNVLEDNGFEVESLPAGWVAYESLLNSLRNGGVALLNLHVIERDGSYYGHHSVAIGVNDNNQIIFNDPYYGPNTTLYDKGLDFQIKGVRVVGKGG